MPSTRSTIHILERRREVARLYLRGEQQYAIGRVLGISQTLVSFDLKALREEWLVSALRDFDALKSEELQRVDEIERAAWQGWARSLEPREITVTETMNGRKRPSKASLRTEGQAGDPRFLQTIQKCIDQRCSILGLGEEQAALKAASQGLAALLDQARQPQPPPAIRPPLAEA